MLHEQNCFLGKVNKIFAPHAKKLCLPFENVSNMPTDFLNQKIVISGNPIRKEILEKFVSKKPSQDIFKILVTGGSQGAKFLSNIVTQAYIAQAQIPKIKLEIVQQCRTEDIGYIAKLCKEYKIKRKISDFFYNMPELLE
jgi:UDP-N-acetylglucosamine--N-acetylmuramyl-(pentapeptide) pyrophosphoryl-undecaprenol N-acetylglucosamine transferase